MTVACGWGIARPDAWDILASPSGSGGERTRVIERSRHVKITDVTVKRYRASHDTRADAAGIQLVEVHTDAGATGTGFVSMASGGGAQGDVVATLVRSTLKPAIVGRDPLLTDDLWRRMYEAVPRRGGDGLVRFCIAAIDFALWDLKGKQLGAPVSALTACNWPDFWPATTSRRPSGSVTSAGALPKS